MKEDQEQLPRDPLKRGGGLEGLSSAYSLDLGAIFNRAHQRFADVLGPMIGYGAILLAIMITLGIVTVPLACLPILGDFLRLIIAAAALAPLIAGFAIVFLAHLRGKPWTFADFFSGFRFYLPLFVNNLLANLVMFVCILPATFINFALVGVQISRAMEYDPTKGPPPSAQSSDPLLAFLSLLYYALLFIGLIVGMVIYIRFFLLCNWLIVDRNCSAIDAIRGQMTISKGHFWGWLGIGLLFGLIGGAGYMACCLPGIFTFPYYMLLITSAYLQATSDSNRDQELYAGL
jgi:hypothetical protein